MELQEADSSIYTEPPPPLAVWFPLGIGDQDCPCAVELAETNPIAVDSQRQDAPKPAVKGRNTRSQIPSRESLVQSFK